MTHIKSAVAEVNASLNTGIIFRQPTISAIQAGHTTLLDIKAPKPFMADGLSRILPTASRRLTP